jgi:hypothetical protein
MSENDWREQLPLKIRTMQIIVAAMAFGSVSFMTVAVFASQNPAQAAGDPIVEYIALLLCGTMICVRVVIPFVMVPQGRKKIRRSLGRSAGQEGGRSVVDARESENQQAGMLIALFQTKIIVCCALLEGPTFFLLIAYVMQRSTLCLAAAVAMVVLLVAHMPTTNRAAFWVENQLRLVDEQA